MIRRIELEPTYRRPDGLWVLDLGSLLLPKTFRVAESSIVCLPPGAIGGEHEHPRTEVWIALGSGLILVSLDDKGAKKEETMVPQNAQSPVMFVVEPHTPHAVVNHGKTPAFLYELADGPQRDVTPVALVKGNPA